MTDNNILATVPGEHIARGASSLPDAESAPDEPHQVVIALPDGRRVRITYRRFKHQHAKTTYWFWVAKHAAVIVE